MRLTYQWWRGLVAAVLGGLVAATAVAAAGTQFIPILGFREGTLRALGIPQANGLIAYLTLLNERDGGIHGVPVVWEECETVWDVSRGIECYERLKTKGPTGVAVMQVFGTALTYALIERARHDQILLIAPGTGRSDASDGRVFPYVFNGPSNSWSQNTAKIRFIGQRAGGMAQLKGLKIAHVYYDNDYGRETLTLLDQQAAQYGFTMQHLAVKPPGLDQKATWLRVKVAQPDWVIWRGAGGFMTSDRPEGSGSDWLSPRQDRGAVPHLRGAGYGGGRGGCHWLHLRHLVWHGSPLPAHPGDSLTMSMPGAGGRGRKRRLAPRIGSGACCAPCSSRRRIRTAMRHFGNQPLTGAQVQWGSSTSPSRRHRSKSWGQRA